MVRRYAPLKVQSKEVEERSHEASFLGKTTRTECLIKTGVSSGRFVMEMSNIHVEQLELAAVRNPRHRSRGDIFCLM